MKTLKVKIKNSNNKSLGKSLNDLINNARYSISPDRLVSIADDALEAFKNNSPNKTIADGWSYTIDNNVTNAHIYFSNDARMYDSPAVFVINYGYADEKKKSYVKGTYFLNKSIDYNIDKAIAQIWKDIRKG